MKRVAATSAYVRSWLPSVWKRALQRLLHFLLRLSMFPRRLLMLERSSGPTDIPPRRRWLRVLEDNEPAADHIEGARDRDTASEGDTLFFAADTALVSTSTRRGLANTGNTCFVNAVVQCLLATPGFVDRLEGEVLRVVEQSQDHATGGIGKCEERKKLTHETHLRLAQSLLDLLKGLLPEEGGEEETVVGPVGQYKSAKMNGTVAAHEKDVGEADHPVTRQSPAALSKKRKRPMITNPGDYSAAATTKRLKCFLQAASKCSDLVAAATQRQEQQDAEELLLFLLDSLHELLRWTPPSPPAKNGSTEPKAVNGGNGTNTAGLAELIRLTTLENDCLQNLKKCVVTDPATYNTTVSFLGDLRWHRYLKENSSFITDLFTGQIVRGSQCCSCANLTCLHQEFRIDASKAVQTLDHCLDTYKDLEDLVADNKVFCDGHCQDKTNRRTQVLLQRAPQALVIQLQRSKQTSWHARAEKIVASVEFPINEPLNLTENMFLRDPTQPVYYELQAVCAHIGNALDAGHYIAYTRERVHSNRESVDAVEPSHTRAEDRWTKFDDDYVTTLDAATVRTETQNTAYLLFYTLVDSAVVEEETKVEPPQQDPNEPIELELEDLMCVENDDNI